jgi:hypothetical protein
VKKIFLICTYIFNLLIFVEIPRSFAVEINCDSPVFKNKPVCIKKREKLKKLNECKLIKNIQNSEIRLYKGNKLFESLDCLPNEEPLVFLNNKGQKKYILTSRVRSLAGSTYLVFENQSAFYIHFSTPVASYPFKIIGIDGEEYELSPKRVSPYTNKYTLNRKQIKAFKSLEESFDIALDPGYRKWSVVREVPVIKKYFRTKKSEWKSRSPALIGRTLPSIKVSQKPQDGSSIFKNSIESLATIELGNGSSGSGFFVDNDLIATNSHVVSGEKDISVITYDKGSHEGEVVYDDELYDFALVKINTQNEYKPLPVCRNSSLKTGDPVYVLGSPGAAIVDKGYLENSITGGLVSSVRYVDEQLFIQTDAAMNPGNSGGPLLNKFGAVVGISTFILSDQRIQGIYFAGEISNIVSESGLIKLDTSMNTKYCGLEKDANNIFDRFF